MAAFQVSGINHVHITAPEELEAQVVEWYENVLGLERSEKTEIAGWRGGTWFTAGNQELHVSVDAHNPPKDAHFGLVVDDLNAVIETLRSHNCHIEQAAAIPGRHRCYTRDPAGNRIELLSFDGGDR
jgi:catechol 2,3-dioxygenase-like lactoylglutathione lyase family enzyme